MPGPFPGIDPYLEDPVLWPGTHHRLVDNIADALNDVLPPGYVADINERLYIVQPERNVYPDVAVLEHPSPHRERDRSGVAATAVTDPPYVVTVEPVEVREAFVEILPVGDEERVVTAIEVLSHANKAPGSHGRDLYLTKQHQLLQSQTHLMEIDLLRTGAPTLVPPPEQLRTRRPTWDYSVSLHRAGRGGTFEVWLNRVRERLPRVPVPLTDGDPDVALDLQAVFDRCYDAGPYRRRVDYRREPTPPLRDEDATWADALLREKGLRP